MIQGDKDLLMRTKLQVYDGDWTLGVCEGVNMCVRGRAKTSVVEMLPHLKILCITSTNVYG